MRSARQFKVPSSRFKVMKLRNEPTPTLPSPIRAQTSAIGKLPNEPIARGVRFKVPDSAISAVNENYQTNPTRVKMAQCHSFYEGCNTGSGGLYQTNPFLHHRCVLPSNRRRGRAAME